MGYSNLCSYIDDGSSNYNVRTAPISKITIHHAAGVVTLEQMSNIMRTPGRTVSWNYAIGNDGRIGGYIDEQYRAWTTSSRANDNIAVTIEVSNSKNGEPWPISDAAYKSLLNLCEDICRRNGIKRIEFTGTKAGNLTMHKWFSSTGCPGPTLEPKFPDIAVEVNRRLGGADTLPYITDPTSSNITAAGAVVTGSVTPITSLLDYSKITPYIATIDRNTSELSASELKASGVIALMIEAGCLYDVIHMPVDNYRNPKLESQVRWARDNNIPYALYADVRSRSVGEAELELKQLKLCVQKYVPPLGVWLTLNFIGTDTVINDAILSKYKQVLESAGLTGKIGLYVNYKQLRTITWSKWCDSMYLWLVDHVDDLSDIQQLLTPEFFMTSKEG